MKARRFALPASLVRSSRLCHVGGHARTDSVTFPFPFDCFGLSSSARMTDEPDYDLTNQSDESDEESSTNKAPLNDNEDEEIKPDLSKLPYFEDAVIRTNVFMLCYHEMVRSLQGACLSCGSAHQTVISSRRNPSARTFPKKKNPVKFITDSQQMIQWLEPWRQTDRPTERPMTLIYFVCVNCRFVDQCPLLELTTQCGTPLPVADSGFCNCTQHVEARSRDKVAQQLREIIEKLPSRMQNGVLLCSSVGEEISPACRVKRQPAEHQDGSGSGYVLHFLFPSDHQTHFYCFSDSADSAGCTTGNLKHALQARGARFQWRNAPQVIESGPGPQSKSASFPRVSLHN